MKKLLKRISVMILALTLSFSAFTGCKKPREEDQYLEVFLANRGYGIDGVNAAFEAFKQQAWVKAKYPNLEIKITPDSTPQKGINAIRSEENNTYDLVFVIEDLAQFFDVEGSTLVDLTEEVYGSKVPEEGDTTVEEKMLEVALDYSKWKVPGSKNEYKYYDMSWCTGYTGMIYNPDIVANYMEEAPRTTDEIIELFKRIKNGQTLEPKPAGVTQAQWNKQNCGNEQGYAFGPCGTSTYDSNLYEILWAQYDGYEAYNDFWNGLWYDKSAGKKIQSSEMFKEKGRLYSLEFLREILDYDSEYYDLSISSVEYRPALKLYLEGKYAMVNCSDYFDTETKYIRESMEEEYAADPTNKVKPADLQILKAPIVSEIVDKLTKKYNNNQKMTDEQLSFVIKCIDEEKDFNTTANEFLAQFSAGALQENDYKRLLEARAIVSAPGVSHTVGIPKVSNSIPVAIDFLRFMSTDVCQFAYMKGSRGQTLPFKIDPSSTTILYGTQDTTVADAYQELLGEDANGKAYISTIQKTRLDIMFNTFNPVKTICRDERKPLSNTAFKSIEVGGDIGTKFREKDAASAQKVFNDTINIMTQSTLNRYLFEAGLRDSY